MSLMQWFEEFKSKFAYVDGFEAVSSKVEKVVAEFSKKHGKLEAAKISDVSETLSNESSSSEFDKQYQWGNYKITFVYF
jgi:hypothetical protein